MKRGFALLSLASLLAVAAAAGFTESASARDFSWKPSDLILAQQGRSFEISPLGDRVVWVRNTADEKKDRRVDNLVLTRLADGSSIELTRGPEGASDPKWAPDGKLIAFVSRRSDSSAGDDSKEPKRQIWLIDPNGGEPWQLTKSDRDVEELSWAGPDNLVFTAKEEPSRYEQETKKRKDSSRVVDDEIHEPPVRLFRIGVKEKKVERLTNNQDRIGSVAVSPDGRWAVTIHDRSLHYVYDQKVKPAVRLWDLTSRTSTPIFAEPLYNVRSIHWANDHRFYVTSETTRDPRYVNATITEVYEYTVGGEGPQKIYTAWDKGLAEDIAVVPDGFLALLADGVTNKLALMKRSRGEWERFLVEGPNAGHIFGIEAARDGKSVVYHYSTANTPDQWFRASLDGNTLGAPLQITKLNPSFKDKPKPRVETVHWKGAGGDQVEGLLYYPMDWKKGTKSPLVVMIHGGPTGVDLDAWQERWAYPAMLMTERGAFVLKVNYHGSSGYGLDWAESISGGKYYELEIPDIESGVDAVIAKGLVDPNQLGVMGWSNGGILTTALTVATNRYKVASSGAGDVDWASDWGNCEFGASFDNYYFGKSPLEDPQLYMSKSPFYHLDRVTTPTLIFFGTEDRKVPTQQGWMHYRALQQLGKTDVRFVLFPGEGHGPSKLTHQHRKLVEELAWFDKYLFNDPDVKNEALQPGSPLDVALRLHAGSSPNAPGVDRDGVRAPQVVKHHGVQVGRFEVTRAEYARFDPSYAVATGTENYPVTGVPLEKAIAYCAWLSQKSGEHYRLPNQEEATKLYDGDGHGNTLDYWAGYAVNPDDAARLAPEIAKLGSGTVLLKPVGSFKGSGDDPVFDLDGNAAEWVVMPDGSGKAMGASADRPFDGREGEPTTAPEYIGFRVVKE
ncbi:MAG: prolyl oligopeptidase family serine peptidase [Thermoanaerobaculia bacterium]